jgi:anaerobic ribonucleoside-triphosphate reductase activating protein
MRLRVNKVHFPVTALGPGTRAGIWVQGCSIHCRGCISHDTWSVQSGHEVDVAELVDWIAGLPEEDLDGVTISGGEPFDQPDALGALLRELSAVSQDRGRTIDVLAYSGYGLVRLRARHGEALARLDAVIVGPYQAHKPTKLIWRGSANQRLIPLSSLGIERYGHYVAFAPSHPPFQVAVDDGVWLIGVPRNGDVDRLEARLRISGIELQDRSWIA